MVGIEPTTNRLTVCCSAAELHSHVYKTQCVIMVTSHHNIQCTMYIEKK